MAKTIPLSLEGIKQTVFIIENMDCPTEEALIRNKLSPLEGIAALDFNLMQRKLTVTHKLEQLDAIYQALTAIGMEAISIEAASKQTQSVNTAQPSSRKKWWLLGFGVAAAVLAEIIAWLTGTDNTWPVIVLALFAIAVSGTGTYKKGWIALKNFNFIIIIRGNTSIKSKNCLITRRVRKNRN